MVRKFRVVTLVPTCRDRLRAVLLLVGANVACTRLVGEVPADVGVVDAADVVTGGDGSSACPSSTPGHAPGEPDLTLRSLVDPRLADFYIKGAAQDALGRIYVCGAMFGCGVAGEPLDVAVLRLTDDGVLDETFGDHGVACTGREPDDSLNNSAFAVAIDGRGRAVLAGDYYVDARLPQGGVLVARFDARGQPDESIGPHGFRRYAVALTPGAPRASSFFVLPEADGLVLTGGENDLSDLSTYGFVMRLRDDGTPDPSFHHGEVWFGPAFWSLSSVARTPAGYVVAGASRGEYSPRIVMLGRDGEPVTTFGSDGAATHTQRGLLVRGLATDARGGYMLAGEVRGSGVTGLVRFDPDGRPDLAFGLDHGVTVLAVPWLSGYQLASALARPCDGRLVVAGSAGANGFTLARVATDGRRDMSFGNDGFVHGGGTGSMPLHVYATLVHPRDGRITVVTSTNDDRDVTLWRYWP